MCYIRMRWMLISFMPFWRPICLHVTLCLIVSSCSIHNIRNQRWAIYSSFILDILNIEFFVVLCFDKSVVWICTDHLILWNIVSKFVFFLVYWFLSNKKIFKKINIAHFCQRSNLHLLEAWLFDLANIGYEYPKLRPHRKFAYLTQGGYLKPSSNPRLNYIDPTEQKNHPANSDFDTFFLSFSGNGSGDLFFPKSTWQQGRNALLRLALANEVSPGYDFLIFTDEDAQLENVENPIHFWKQNMSSNPWVRIEVWCEKN